MNNKDNLFGAVKNILQTFETIAVNLFLSITRSITDIFQADHGPEKGLFLPAGTGNLLENGAGRDFYTAPIRISRKSL